MEHWLNSCQTTWSELNNVLKELGLPEESLPEKYKMAFCDPLKWGEPKKPEVVPKRKRKNKITASNPNSQ